MNKKIYQIKDGEINWAFDYGIYALNQSTMIFENCSGFSSEEKCILALYSNSTDENDISVDILKMKESGMKIVFTLYNEMHNLCGYVYSEN